jgi:citrate synthase
VPGYGHPTHTNDPRTKKLLEIAEETRTRGPHVELAKIMESLTDKFFRNHLILNVDGCIAGIISDMGFDWRLGKGFFIVSRTPGLVAHAYEQTYFEKPYKAANWKEIVYTGPAEKSVPGQ